MPRLNMLPSDVLREVTSHIDSPIDIFNLILTSKSLHYHLFTLLYRDIQIRDLQSSLKLVQFLLANPQIARSVISITLRPNYLLKANAERLAGEKELAHAVELLAPNLYQLQRFVWDGIENAPSKMWANLRAGCPQLKHIGTNIGNQLLDPDSELFAFSDLHSFWLTTELHYRDFGSLYTLHGEELPPAMWAMLIGRCFNLECLVLGDSGMMRMRSKRKLSIRPLLQARWPKLNSLRISNASILYEDDIFSGLPKIQFINFLNFHGHSLRELKYHDLSGASTRAGYAEPPHLQYRSCGVPYMSFPASHMSSLQELSLTDQPYCGAHQLANVKQYLSLLSALRSLSIWVDFSADVQDREEASDEFDGNGRLMKQKWPAVWYDQVRELQELYQSCPRGLESFKLMDSTRSEETFYWRDIPTILRRPEMSYVDGGEPFSLKHLEVWKVWKGGDVVLGVAAAHIALDEKPKESSPAQVLPGAGSTRPSMSTKPSTSSASDSASSSFTLGTPNATAALTLTHPSLDTIVLAACTDQWCSELSHSRPRIGHLSRFHLDVVQHSTFRVKHHSMTSSERPPQLGSGLGPLKAFNFLRFERQLTHAISSLSPPPSSPTSSTTTTPPPEEDSTKTVVTLSANERGTEILASRLTQRYALELTYSPPPPPGRRGWRRGPVLGRIGGKKFVVDNTRQTKRFAVLDAAGICEGEEEGLGSLIGSKGKGDEIKRVWRLRVVKPAGGSSWTRRKLGNRNEEEKGLESVGLGGDGEE